MQRHGSLVNLLAGNGQQAEPEIGTPATVLAWSDRYAVEVAEITRFKSGARKGQVKEVKVRRLNVTLVSGSEHDGSARYEYASNPDNPIDPTPFKRSTTGEFRKPDHGNRLSIGRAEEYRDPSF